MLSKIKHLFRVALVSNVNMCEKGRMSEKLTKYGGDIETLCTPFELTSSAQRRPSLGHFITTLRQSFS